MDLSCRVDPKQSVDRRHHVTRAGRRVGWRCFLAIASSKHEGFAYSATDKGKIRCCAQAALSRGDGRQASDRSNGQAKPTITIPAESSAIPQKWIDVHEVGMLDVRCFYCRQPEFRSRCRRTPPGDSAVSVERSLACRISACSGWYRES